MPDLGMLFKADAIDTTSNFDPIPAGDYQACVLETDIKDTKAGTGKYVAVTLEVVEGPHKGQKLWHNINFRNQSAKAQEIGQKQLAELSKACGVTDLVRTEQLHGKIVRVKVGQEDGQDGTKRNIVKAYDWKALANVKSPSAAAGPKGKADDIEEEDVPF